MAITEHQRLQLAEAATASFGEDVAAILMELLVPAGDHPATRRDLDAHIVRMDDRFEAFGTRMDERMTAFETRMDDRMTAFETRMDERMTAFETRMDDRMTAFEHRVDAKIDAKIDALRDDLTAVFRAELVTAVSGQTRPVIVSLATAVFGIGGLAVTLAQLLG